MSIGNKIPILALLFVLLLSACHEPSGMTKVVHIIDGDTVVIEGGHHVRYLGIDAPEKSEFYYLEAIRANKELVEGKKVRLERDVSDKDKYGRLLRYVYVDGIFVGAEMVRQGYACAKAYPPDVKYLVYLEAVEEQARYERRGIWGHK